MHKDPSSFLRASSTFDIASWTTDFLAEPGWKENQFSETLYRNYEAIYLQLIIGICMQLCDRMMGSNYYIGWSFTQLFEQRNLIHIQMLTFLLCDQSSIVQ